MENSNNSVIGFITMPMCFFFYLVIICWQSFTSWAPAVPGQRFKMCVSAPEMGSMTRSADRHPPWILASSSHTDPPLSRALATAATIAASAAAVTIITTNLDPGPSLGVCSQANCLARTLATAHSATGLSQHAWGRVCVCVCVCVLCAATSHISSLHRHVPSSIQT